MARTAYVSLDSYIVIENSDDMTHEEMLTKAVGYLKDLDPDDAAWLIDFEEDEDTGTFLDAAQDAIILEADDDD